MALTSPCPTPRIVLDTNVVLDWMVFGDFHGRTVGQKIASGALRWIATAAMRDEHFEVLARAKLERWFPRADEQMTLWTTHCQVLADQSETPGMPKFHCSDPDDQMFVDLAVVERPTWLLTRDKAVLTLARQLAGYGVETMTPARWVAAYDGAAGRMTAD